MLTPSSGSTPATFSCMLTARLLLSETKGRSRAAGYHYLSSLLRDPTVNPVTGLTGLGLSTQ
jgi:hypothetical protein